MKKQLQRKKNKVIITDEAIVEKLENLDLQNKVIS